MALTRRPRGPWTLLHTFWQAPHPARRQQIGSPFATDPPDAGKQLEDETTVALFSK